MNPPTGMGVCPNCNGYGSSLSETAPSCTRCRGTGLVAAPRRISELTPAELQGVITEYDVGMRRYTELRHDAMRAVADNADGEVLCEVIDTAVRMGYAVEESPFDWKDVDLLQTALHAYQLRLRTELADTDDAGHARDS